MTTLIRASTILKLETQRRLNELNETAFHFARTRGLPQDSLRYVLEGRIPSVDRAQTICMALGLEFYLGPPRSEEDETTPLYVDLSTSPSKMSKIDEGVLARSIAQVLSIELKMTQRFAAELSLIYDKLHHHPNQFDMIEKKVVDHYSPPKGLDQHLLHACLTSLEQWMKDNHTSLPLKAQAEILVNLYVLASNEDCLSNHSTEEQAFFDSLLRMIHTS